MSNQYRKALHRLASILLAKRLEYGLTQEQVAEFMQCSTRWYQKIEAGTSNPSWKDILRLMFLFHLDSTSVTQEVGLVVPVSSF